MMDCAVNFNNSRVTIPVQLLNYVTCIPHSNGWQSVVSLPLPWFSTQKIEEQRRKDLANPCTGEEWGHRHRIKIQTHTQNKEQMLTRASQVTFVKKIYIKYYFILENVVEWAILLKCLQVSCNSEPIHFYSAFHWSEKLMLSKKNIS